MKRMFGLLFFIFIMGVGNVLAQSAVASIQNPQIIGDTLTYDVYLRNSTSGTLYLSDLTLYFTFDGTKISASNASVSFTSALPPSATFTAGQAYYGTTPRRISADLAFSGSTITTTNTVALSNTGNGTKLGTVKLEHISSFTGNAGLDWSTTAPYVSTIYYWNQAQDSSLPLTVTYAQAPTISLAPQFDAIVANQQLFNGDYTFDLFIRHQGGAVFYLDNSDFVFNYDNTKFGGGSAISMVMAGTTQLTNFYSFSPSLSGSNIRIQMDGPVINNQSEFNQQVQLIAGPGDSTFIGRFKITNALGGTTVTQVNPTWDLSAPAPQTLVRNRQNISPFNGDVITTNGNYIIDAPVFSVTVTSPNGGETICPNSSFTITYNSSNVANVKIDLYQGGVLNSTIISSTAATGTFNWAVGNLAAGNNYKIRITDVSTPARFDESDGNFSIGATPAITGQPGSTSVIAGSTATFTVTATNGLSYQWQKEVTTGVFSNIAGATNSTLILSNVQASDAGNYRVIVSGTCNPAATSSVASLTVIPQGLTIAVKAYLQGMWNGTTHIPAPVSVEVRSGVDLLSSTLVGRTAGMLGTAGSLTVQINGVVSGNYWLVVRAAGYAAVGSASQISMSSGVTVNYDFTDLASKAANNGTTPVDVNGTTYFMLKGGDLNGNNAVNPTDLNIFKDGYQKSNTGVPVAD